MVYPGAEPTAEGRCGTPNHRPLPNDSCKDGSPRRGESVHIQSKGPPEELRSPCLGPLPLPDCPSRSASAARTQYLGDGGVRPMGVRGCVTPAGDGHPLVDGVTSL